MFTFNAYRYNLLEPNQKNMFDLKTKEEHFNNLLIAIHKAKKEVFIHFGNKNILFHHSQLTDTIFLLQLAKEETFQKPTEGSEELLEVTDIRFPFIFIIVDVQRQILLIQERTSIMTIESIVNRLEAHWTSKLSEYHIVFTIRPINDSNNFWDELKDAEQIEEFDVTLNAPNLFRGRFEASKFVQEVYDEYNITDFTMRFRNKIGQLKVVKENVEDLVKLAAAGAGEFALRIIDKGVKKTIKSIKWVVKKVYTVNRIEDLDVQQLENDLRELDTLSEIDNEDGREL